MSELDIMFIITIIRILNNLEGPAIYKLCFSVGPSIFIHKLSTLYVHIHILCYLFRMYYRKKCMFIYNIDFIYTLSMNGNENKINLKLET